MADSVTYDSEWPVVSNQLDLLDLTALCKMDSQSDLKKGDWFGCIDGSDLLIEMADSARHKFMWFRCPEINKDKDSTFAKLNTLCVKLQQLSAGGSR